MAKEDWQLQTQVTAIAFDCDGTLSAIEGIDELAKNKGTAAEVKALTEKAMAKTGITPEIYRKRLDLILPNRDQVLAIGYLYYSHKVPDISQVIAILMRLQKSIYVVSAGILTAVQIFAEKLRIPLQHVYAVNMEFDQSGNFVDYDQTSPLLYNNGKAVIIEQLKKIHRDIVYVGDGMNDLSVKNDVIRFVGYGGSFYRENIAKHCQFYIKTNSMAPLLPLVLTQDEYHLLLPQEKLIYEKGRQAILAGEV